MNKVICTKNISLALIAILSMSCVSDLNPGDTSMLKADHMPQTKALYTAGDGVYDALGYGYDITEEYLGDESATFRVLDVPSFVNDHPDRFDNPYIGIIVQECFAGENAVEFIEQVANQVGFAGSLADNGTSNTGAFTRTLSMDYSLENKYEYSSKYSFALAQILKKHRRYVLNADASMLSNYLSQSFLEDLENLTPERIVEIYGTHVLTDITIGGRYSALYKSLVAEYTTQAEKKLAVDAGVKTTLSDIGLDVNGSWDSATLSSLNQKNAYWMCNVKVVGGNTSGTVLSLNPNNSTSISINLDSWASSVDDTHSRVVGVNWDAAYPIYEFVTDEVKKSALRQAVNAYVESREIDMLETKLIYRSYNRKDHFYCDYYSPTYGDGSWQYECVAFSVCSNQVEGTVPLYQYWNHVDHFYSVGYHPNGISNWSYQGIVGYVYTAPSQNLIPLYRYYNGKDHFYTTIYNESQNYDFEQVECYVYPAM